MAEDFDAGIKMSVFITWKKYTMGVEVQQVASIGDSLPQTQLVQLY